MPAIVYNLWRDKMKTYLKIKISSLAAEASIIKREEAKWKKAPFANSDTESNEKLHHPIFYGLKLHRLHEVRPECRHAHIAYGYLRGRAYKQIENKCYEEPQWARVAELVRKYSGGKYITAEHRKTLADDLKAWAAKELLEKAA
jgi:hypothetical protein